MTTKVTNIADVLNKAPSNWGRWGAEDELGAVNFLDQMQVLRGVASVKKGKVFTLGCPIARKEGDPVWPGRSQPGHHMTQDHGTYCCGKLQPLGAGLQYADDVIYMAVQGTTQFDALGHVWYDDKVYNGFSAATTIDGMEKCSIMPIAEHGVVGRGLLLDVARYKNKKHLDKGEEITLDDLLATADAQGVTIEKRDIILIRTGWLSVFYDQGAAAFYEGDFNEPGITYTPELVQWFYDMEIPAFGTDTIANEQTVSSRTGTALPLHGALLRNLGVSFNEIDWLEDLAEDCANDGQYTFLYTAAPLKIVQGTGAPVNPIVIK